MSIELAERLKREWTDCYVVVKKRVPELRRFDGLVGQVKTVNMNCRLLVEFASTADISWYDIDPAFVKLAPAPQPETSSEESASSPPAATTASVPSAETTSAKAAAPASPLDRIRQQAAGRTAPAEAQPKQPSGGATSSLDRIRQQAAADRETPAAPSPLSGSPLDRIRAQNAASLAAPASAAPSPAKPKLRDSLQDASAQTTPSSSEATASQISHLSATSDKSPASVIGDPPPSAEPVSRTSNPVQHFNEDSGAETDLIPSTSVIPSSGTGNDFPGNAVTSLFAQVRDQARDEQSPAQDSAVPAAFLQVQQQVDETPTDSTADSNGDDTAGVAPAAEDRQMTANCDVTGMENPVATTFKGKAIPKLNDLTVVEGIGRKIEERLHGAGVDSWSALSQADPVYLKQILEDAGPQFRMHCPDSWPHQAKLADAGRWQELEEFQSLLHAGRLETT